MVVVTSGRVLMVLGSWSFALLFLGPTLGGSVLHPVRSLRPVPGLTQRSPGTGLALLGPSRGLLASGCGALAPVVRPKQQRRGGVALRERGAHPGVSSRREARVDHCGACASEVFSPHARASLGWARGCCQSSRRMHLIGRVWCSTRCIRWVLMTAHRFHTHVTARHTKRAARHRQRNRL